MVDSNVGVEKIKDKVEISLKYQKYVSTQICILTLLFITRDFLLSKGTKPYYNDVIPCVINDHCHIPSFTPKYATLHSLIPKSAQSRGGTHIKGKSS